MELGVISLETSNIQEMSTPAERCLRNIQHISYHALLDPWHTPYAPDVMTTAQVNIKGPVTSWTRQTVHVQSVSTFTKEEQSR